MARTVFDRRTEHNLPTRARNHEMAVEFLIPLHRSDLKVDKRSEHEFSQSEHLVATISKGINVRRPQFFLKLLLLELETSFKEGSKSIVNQFERCCYIIM